MLKLIKNSIQILREVMEKKIHLLKSLNFFKPSHLKQEEEEEDNILNRL
jgi:hypothetical protein